MVVQELFTNASKHGALRVPGGTVEVSWTVKPGPAGSRLDLHWIESRAVPPDLRARRHGGLGLALIEGIVRSDLRGRVSFGDTNGHWTVDIAAVLDASAIRSSNAMHEEVCTS
jgi:two-component sensor histidine kinase